MSVGRINRCCADADENFILLRRGLFNISQLKIFDTIFARENSFHGIGWHGPVPIAVVSGSPVSDEEPDAETEQQHKCGPFKYASEELHSIVIAIFPLA